MTPLMKQYWDIKSQHPDELVLFRMGDFYELFADDAKHAAPILGIALTARNKKSGDHTPMCGFPHHSYEAYVNKLVEEGLRVAICEQMEDAKLAKGLVKRAVTRRFSPSVPLNTEAHAEPNFMGAFDKTDLVIYEASTRRGEIHLKAPDFLAQLKKFQVVELLVKPEQVRELPSDILDQWPLTIMNEEGSFSPSELIRQHLKNLDSKTFDPTSVQFEKIPKDEFLFISDSSFESLEIFGSSKSKSKFSFFSSINRTQTPGGHRLIQDWVARPLSREKEILSRQSSVTHWIEKSDELPSLRQILSRLGDVQRRVVRFSSDYIKPKDFYRLKESVMALLDLKECLDLSNVESLQLEELKIYLESALNDESLIKEESFVRQAFDSEFDELSSFLSQIQVQIEEFQKEQRELTSIGNLKVKHNNIFGYYIEVSKTQSSKVPEIYRRKQSLVNAERYTHPDLELLEEKIQRAQFQVTEIESKIFDDIHGRIRQDSALLLTCAQRSNFLDVVSSLAWLAIENKYCLPVFSTDRTLDLKLSRHPVIEQVLKSNYQPNSIQMKAGDCLLITGPNMAGKSTVMRQVALTVILAQMGSYVPATQALLPIYTSLWTRIGAHDDLSSGQSTFMVEMIEAAEMLSQGTESSLFVLDEIGRGTSTYDGLSLARSILEFLCVKIKGHSLFSTHYHELTELKLESVKQAHMSAQMNDGKLKFTYQLCEGPSQKSYGVEVAALAGVPRAVVEKAKVYLDEYETQKQPTLDLFNWAQRKEVVFQEETSKESILWSEIQNLKLDEITPRQALERLFQWQKST